MENFTELFFFLIKNRTTIWYSNPTSGYIHEGNEINILKTRLHPCVYRGIVCNSQGMEATQVSIDGEMDKENTIFINTHMPLSLEELTRCKVRNLLVSCSWPSGWTLQDPVVLWHLLWEKSISGLMQFKPMLFKVSTMYVVWLLNHKKEGKPATGDNMAETWGHL